MTENAGQLLAAPTRLIGAERVSTGPAAAAWPPAEAREIYRSIYSRVEIGSFRSLAICSAVEGEGKTTTALALAVVVAHDFPARKIVLIEAATDGALAATLGLPAGEGFSDLLAGGAPVERVCRTTNLENLDVVPAGSRVTNITRFLRSGRLRQGLDALRARYDLAVIDVPPVLASSDAEFIGAAADASILVVRAGKTPDDLVTEAARRLSGNLRGVVLNDMVTAVPAGLRRMTGW